MAEAGKDTIYIDVDDEITAIIDKVKDSQQKIVALVLPKRSAVLQSIVNMKLLKRTATTHKKQVVLITSEASILPIAGAVGVHVAKTLQSKPDIPPPPELPKDEDELVDDASTEKSAGEVDKTKSIGELAGLPATAEAAKAGNAEETIDIDNPDEAQPTNKKSPADKSKKGKIKVPNFDKFRTRLFLAGLGLVLLIIFLFLATKVWPHATVTIKTSAASVNTDFGFTADTTAQTLDETKNIVPATTKDEVITSSQKVSATGQKNIGDTATGSVGFTAQACAPNLGTPSSVPAGTTVTTNGHSFTTQSDASFNFSGFSGGSCANYTSSAVGITAQSAGSQYNVSSGSSFSVSGRPGVSGTGSASGGTDNNVTVIQQSDIDGAVDKIIKNTDKPKSDLSSQLKDIGLFPLPATITGNKQNVSSDANVGDQASDVTVTVQVDFTMLGVKRDDLKKLVIDAAKSQIDVNKQKISDDGLDKATISVADHKSATNQTLSIQTTASAGAQIDVSSLQKQIIGKKSGDVQQMVQDLPDVQSVTVKYSPFWVSKAPNSIKKIRIVIQQSQGQ